MLPLKGPSAFYGRLPQDQKERVLQNVRQEAARRFKKYREAVKEAVGLPELKGAALLEAYRNRTPDVWSMLQQYFPDEYGRQMAEWGKMEQTKARPAPSTVLQSPDAKIGNIVPMPREGV